MKSKEKTIKITTRIPLLEYKKMERRKKATMRSINLQIFEAIKKDKEIQKYAKAV